MELMANRLDLLIAPHQREPYLPKLSASIESPFFFADVPN